MPAPTSAQASIQFTARPAETVVIPFAAVRKALPDLMFDQVIVRDARGAVIPSQVTAMKHVHKGPAEYDELIFQCDLRANEQHVSRTLESTATPQPPFVSKVWAGYVPERWDDFAWENDVIAHRAYGPALAEPLAGKDQMTSSGIDLWTKKVRYLVADRWYRKGHDGLHTEGRPDSLLLVKVKPGETLRYFAGGAWKPAGKITTTADWNVYLTSTATRLATPIRVEINGAPVSASTR